VFSKDSLRRSQEKYSDGMQSKQTVVTDMEQSPRNRRTQDAPKGYPFPHWLPTLRHQYSSTNTPAPILQHQYSNTKPLEIESMDLLGMVTQLVETIERPATVPGEALELRSFVLLHMASEVTRATEGPGTALRAT
jgi:hypothetical protein